LAINTSSGRREVLYPISGEGKWGFINASGEVVIQPQFLNFGEFSEGLAKVTVPGLTEEDQVFERTASGSINERVDFVIGPSPKQRICTGVTYQSDAGMRRGRC
jgi:WG repeat protein